MLKLCSICKILAMLYKFNILFLLSYLNYKIINISSLSSSSIQSSSYIINNLYSYIHSYINTLNSFCCICNFSQCIFDKIMIITTDSPKSHNSVKNMQWYKFCQLGWHFCLLCWHYAHCFCFPKLCWHNSLKPSTDVPASWTIVY